MVTILNREFACTQCTGCCHAINLRQYNLDHWGLSIGKDGYCVNLKDNVCTIYEDRPLLCRVGEVYDRYKELQDVEPALYELVTRIKTRGLANPKVEYFKIANMGCNMLIQRLQLPETYLINVNEVYTEVGTQTTMAKTDRKESRGQKKDDRRDYKIEKIKAATAKALAVAKKRKWLVLLIGAAVAAYFVLSSGGLGSAVTQIKGLFGG